MEKQGSTRPGFRSLRDGDNFAQGIGWHKRKAGTPRPSFHAFAMEVFPEEYINYISRKNRKFTLIKRLFDEDNKSGNPKGLPQFRLYYNT